MIPNTLALPWLATKSIIKTEIQALTHDNRNRKVVVMTPAKAKKRTEHEAEAAQLLDKDIFLINQERLDKEWLDQPKLFGKYAEKLADARYEVAIAEAKFNVVRAETDMAIRENPGKFGIEKVTESGIAAASLLTKEVRRAQQTVLNKKHLVDLLQAAVNALDHRKRALENLVKLFGMDYFSKPMTDDAAASSKMTDSSTKHTRTMRAKKK